MRRMRRRRLIVKAGLGSAGGRILVPWTRGEAREAIDRAAVDARADAVLLPFFPALDPRAHPPENPGQPMHLARRVCALELSVTLALDARAKELIAAGRDIVNMSVGEPDFAAPQAAREAAVKRVQSGDVKYTPAAGTLQLREALARHLGATRGVAYRPDQVTVCHSAKHALSGALMALVEEQDEVLVPLPAWVSYTEIVRIAGARPVTVPPRAGCRPDLDGLTRAVTRRTRAILINSPCNP